MMLFLKKRLSLHPLRCCLLHLSPTLTTATRNPPPKSNFVADYLIETCGFSQKKAATASKRINFTSRSKPDSVRHFLKHNASFTDAQINSIIYRYFKILRANVDRTMEPNLDALRRITSWSTSEIEQLVVANPSVLTCRQAISRLEYWKIFLNGDMKKLLRALKKNPGLLGYDVDKGTVVKKIAILKEYGLSHIDIGSILVANREFFSSSAASLEVALKKAEGLGLRRGSIMYMHCLYVLSKIGANTFDAKMDFYKRNGWSEKEFLAAFSKAPYFVAFSEDKIREKLDFLVERAGCDHSYIASNPVLLMLSLEKRLMPRLRVLQILKSANLLGNRKSLSKAMRITDSEFIVNFIDQNKEKVPELHEIYIAACAGHVRL